MSAKKSEALAALDKLRHLIETDQREQVFDAVLRLNDGVMKAFRSKELEGLPKQLKQEELQGNHLFIGLVRHDKTIKGRQGQRLLLICAESSKACEESLKATGTDQEDILSMQHLYGPVEFENDYQSLVREHPLIGAITEG